MEDGRQISDERDLVTKQKETTGNSKNKKVHTKDGQMEVSKRIREHCKGPTIHPRDSTCKRTNTNRNLVRLVLSRISDVRGLRMTKDVGS